MPLIHLSALLDGDFPPCCGWRNKQDLFEGEFMCVYEKRTDMKVESRREILCKGKFYGGMCK